MKRPFLRSSLLLPVFVAVPLAARAAVPVGDARAEEDRRLLADGLFSRGLYRQAAGEYQRLVEDFPESEAYDLACFRLGESRRLSDSPVEALKAYKRVLDVPQSEYRATALFKRATIFAGIGQCDTAEELFRTLLSENPDREVRELALYYHASTLETLGSHAEAAAELETQLRDYPEGDLAPYARLSLACIRALPGETHNPALVRKLLLDLIDRPADPRLRAEALFLLGASESAAGEYGAAATAFSRLLSECPDDERAAEARAPAAWAYWRSGRAQEALALCDAALAGDPPPPSETAVQLRYVRAQALFELARLDEAARAFAAVADDPAAAGTAFPARARFQEAFCRFKSRDFAAAEAALRPILSDKEMRPDALWLLGESAAAASTNGSDSAIEAYRRLAAEYPESDHAPEALYQLGLQYWLRRSWMDSATAFHRVVEQYPSSELAPRALLSSADALSFAGESARALRDWQTFLRDWPQDPEVPEALYRSAIELMVQGRRTEAITQLEDLLRRFPESPRRAQALYWKGDMLRAAGDLSGAVTALRAALAAGPGDALSRDVRFSLGVALQADGREDEAADLFQQIVEESSDGSRFTPGQLEWLAEYQCDRGDFERACVTARRMTAAAETDEDRQNAWALLGRAHRAAGRAREAEDAYRRAREFPVRARLAPEAALRLGQLLLARGAAEESVPCFRDAVSLCATEELQPLRIWAYEGLGHAALRLGDRESAVRYLMTVGILYDDPKLVPPVLLEAARLLDELGRAEEAADVRATLRRDFPDSDAARSLGE